MNFTSINGAGYSPSTIMGDGASLSLNASQNQFLSMKEPFLDLSNASWTFELWIYPRSISSASDSSLLGQCQSKTFGRCLHLVIRNGTPYLGFYADDLIAQQSLLSLRWYHLAFVFDCNTRNQSIYIDGFLDSTRQTNATYQGDQGNLTIGTSEILQSGVRTYHNGLIDQLSLIRRSKAADEILRDASLTAHFSFDNGSTADKGPLNIDGSRSGSTSFSVGRVGDGLRIDNVSDSFFQVSGLVLLGRTDQAYSLAVWIRPSLLRNSTIIHVTSTSTGGGWCIPMLTLTSSGQLRAMSWSGGNPRAISGPIVSVNQWSHAVVTYSLSNGLLLYVNGSLYNSSTSFSYSASDSVNYLFLGSSLAGSPTCGLAPIFNGQYTGLVDELRLYSREITSSEVFDLANPWFLFFVKDSTDDSLERISSFPFWQGPLFSKLFNCRSQSMYRKEEVINGWW